MLGRLSKEDLIAAGLDPDKLALFQEKGVTKDDLTAMSTALETKITASLTDQIKNSFTELETKLRTPAKKEAVGDGSEGDDKPDEQTEFLTDPTGYINKKTNGVVVAAAVEFKKMSRDMAWKEGVRSLRGFNNSTIKAEIETEWKKYSPEIMARNGTDPVLCLQQIHDMVLGAHHDEIVQDTNKKDGKFNLVHSGTGAGSGNTGAVGSSGTSGNKVELSDAEQAMARKFGMTPEEWIKQGEDMEKEEVDRKAGILTGVKG